MKFAYKKVTLFLKTGMQKTTSICIKPNIFCLIKQENSVFQYCFVVILEHLIKKGGLNCEIFIAS